MGAVRIGNSCVRFDISIAIIHAIIPPLSIASERDDLNVRGLTLHWVSVSQTAMDVGILESVG